ncbi:MAG: sugar phosphate isomerase/epimerase [Clostridia bacterium]|nr:sugar phosphate isomerase/epimerase [Clostridia bacterium]
MLICEQTEHLESIYPLEQALSLIKEAGFDAADLSLFHLEKNPRWMGEDYKEKAKQIGDYARSIVLPILQAHAPFSFKYKERDFEEIFQIVYRGVEIAALAGAKKIVVHPLHYAEYEYHEEEWFEANMAYYRRFKPLCEQYGVQICVENMWKTHKYRKCIDHSVCSRPEEFIRYLDTLNADGKNHFTACLDLGHIGLVGEKPDRMIALLGKRIGALHIHDNNYREDSHTLPGLGKMPMELIFSALKKAGYEGIFTLEADNFLKNIPLPLLPNALSFMAETARYYANLF